MSTDTLKQHVQAAQAALQATQTLIDSQCDGPLTLYSALQTLAPRLEAVETETALVDTLVTDLLTLTEQLKAQRDAALAASYRFGMAFMSRHNVHFITFYFPAQLDGLFLTTIPSRSCVVISCTTP
jgi:hypothetical protein